MGDCLFCKIASGAIPADVVYEDSDILAFRDISPQAPCHILIIPRIHIATLNDIDSSCSDVISRVYEVAAKVAASEGLADSGYRIVANCMADAGQTVFHIHFHLLGGRRMNWPPG